MVASAAVNFPITKENLNFTPTAGANSSVIVGGTAVVAIPAYPNGGYITNPVTAADQGIAVAENLYVNIVGNASLTANGTTFALGPGQTWIVTPGQTTPTTVNAVTPGHSFSVVCW